MKNLARCQPTISYVLFAFLLLYLVKIVFRITQKFPQIFFFSIFMIYSENKFYKKFWLKIISKNVRNDGEKISKCVIKLQLHWNYWTVNSRVTLSKYGTKKINFIIFFYFFLFFKFNILLPILELYFQNMQQTITWKYLKIAKNTTGKNSEKL